MAFDEPENNDWLAVNQFTVSEPRLTRWPDIVLFGNGSPLGIVELHNPADEDATIWTAFEQLQTYRAEQSTLYAHYELLIICDGLEPRLGRSPRGANGSSPGGRSGESRSRMSASRSSKCC